MSDKNKIPQNDNESIKKFKSSCTNFIKMLAEEKSDSIKLSYLSGLTKSVQKLSISPEIIVEIIFKNILFENLNILKSPNLLIAFISFCRKTHDNTFQNYFYELLYKFVGDYDDNMSYFKEYLIMLSLEIFFDSIQKNEEDLDSMRKFLNLMIFTDTKEFKDQFFKIIFKEKIKLMDNKIKIGFLINFFEIIIAKCEYQIGIMLLKVIIEEIKGNLPDELIGYIINFENNNGFNSIIKKKKEINEFLTFNQIILENISQEFINNKNNDIKLDVYFSNLINILCIKKEFNTEIIKYVFEYFTKYKNTMLTKNLPINIYYLSNFAYTNNQISFLFNVVCKSKDLNPIYKWIIYKNPLLYNKATLIQSDFKPTLNDINIIIDENKKNEKEELIGNLIEKTLISNEEQSNIYLLVHLTLYDFIINSSFKNNQSNYNIDFYSLNKILELLMKFPVEQINKAFYNEFIQFLLDFLAVLFEFCASLKNDSNEEIIIKAFNNYFNIFRKIEKSKEVQFSIIYPSLLNIISNKQIKINFLEPVIDYLIDIFSRSTRQNDKIFRIIKGLLINKEQKVFENKFFLADKLINLVLSANEHKLFELLFSLSNELIKTNDDFNIKLGYYIINKYSKLYDGALSDLLQNYIIAKFDELYVQKKISVEEIKDEDYYIINTIDNIYIQDKPTNLKEIVDKLYGDNYKKIINIFDNLFEYMDKIENNKEIFRSNIKENNLVEEYCYMKNIIKEILDFYSFIKKDYVNNSVNNNNFKENKKLYCVYGTTYYLVHLLAQYLSEKIENEKSIENEEEKKVENDKLMLIFDYIYEKVLLNQNIKNIAFKSFFINAILANQTILDYYLVKHTNNLVNLQIKEKESDFSQLGQLSSSINTKKSFGLIKLINKNPYNIILMNKLIIELFNYESDAIINPQKVDLYQKNSEKPLIIKNIYTNKLFNKVNEFYTNINNTDNNNQISNSTNNDIQTRINACFSKIFFNHISNFSNMKNITIQIYFIFCLDNEIFTKYYNSFSDFYDFDYTILQFYSLIRNQNCKLEFKEKFLHFLKKFSFIESVNVFSLRILSEEKTFQKLFSKNYKHSQNEIILLHDIIISLFNNLLKYNSYKDYTENIIKNIINNLLAFTNELLLLSKNDDEKLIDELNQLGKLINYIFEQFSTENNNQKKDSKSINSNLIKNINKELEDKYKSNNINNNNQELVKFIQAQGNISKENKQKRFDFMDNNLMIDNYVNNPNLYPFPIENYMNKFNENK